MYGIFAYVHHKHQLNVGEYIIHGWYGIVRLRGYDYLIIQKYLLTMDGPML